MNIDLSQITLLQLLIITAAVAVVDTLSGIVGAVSAHTFSIDVVAQFLQTHVLQLIFPIVGLAFLSQTLGSGTGAPGAAVWALAIGGLAAYIAETVASISSNLGPQAPAA